ncbi:MAG: hypothetical protein MUE38_04140, partial [Flavihumibacter sp.]|nr:hypothetical protein [Flavihumibacter sp.]
MHNYECCFMTYGLKMVGKDYTGWTVVEAIPAEAPVTFTEAEQSLQRILRTWLGFAPETVPMGERWNKGKMVLVPGDSSTQSKEVPIET